MKAYFASMFAEVSAHLAESKAMKGIHDLFSGLSATMVVHNDDFSFQ